MSEVFDIPPVASTDAESSEKIVNDDPFNELTMTPRVQVEKLDLDKNLEESEDEKGKTETKSENSDDSEYEPESSDDSSVVSVSDNKRKRKISSEDSDDPDYNVNETSRRKNVKKKLGVNKNAKQFKKEEVVMSAYEKMVQQKKLESMAFLRSLKIDEVKSSINAMQKKKPRIIKKKEYLGPARKSERTKNSDIDYTDKGLFQKGIVYAEVKREDEEDYIIPLPSKMSFEDALASKNMYTKFKDDIRIQAVKHEEKSILYNSVLQKLPFKFLNQAEVTPESIECLTWYPSFDSMVLAAGDQLGNIGIWNVNSDSDPHVFKVHNERTTHVQFNPFNPVEMLSCSYEGTLRCGDMEQNMFTQVFRSDIDCLYFDFLSSTSCLVALKNGTVAIVDRNTRRNSASRHFCHEGPVKTVNVHPINKNIFVTAGKSARIWDLRMLRNQPIADLYHQKSVSSAFFSSVTGNSLLTKLRPGEICIFDSTNITQDIRQTQKLAKRVTDVEWKISAEWLPNSDDMFVVGNLRNRTAHPSRVQLYNKKSRTVHLLTNENLIIKCNTFHPFVPALAGGKDHNRKVFVFT